MGRPTYSLVTPREHQAPSWKCEFTPDSLGSPQLHKIHSKIGARSHAFLAQSPRETGPAGEKTAEGSPIYLSSQFGFFSSGHYLAQVGLVRSM